MAETAERDDERGDSRRSNNKPKNVRTNLRNNQAFKLRAYPKLKHAADGRKGERLEVVPTNRSVHRRGCKQQRARGDRGANLRGEVLEDELEQRLPRRGERRRLGERIKGKNSRCVLGEEPLL
jgi:hypothetical protein